MNREVTMIKMSNGNYNTRLNPINRHSKEGFKIRREKKLKRKFANFTSSRWEPVFFQNKNK